MPSLNPQIGITEYCCLIFFTTDFKNFVSIIQTDLFTPSPCLENIVFESKPYASQMLSAWQES